MPIKRRLTKDELRIRRSTGDRSVNAYTDYTFLTDEENALLRASLDNNDTTDEFLARFDDLADGDREALVSQFDRSRAARVARATQANRRPHIDAAPVRERQPVSPSNPFGAYLDDRHDNLPEYPATGHAQRTKLQEASKDYRTAARLLEDTMDAMTDEFADAFAKEDERRAVRERIASTGSPQVAQDHRKRMNRIG